MVGAVLRACQLNPRPGVRRIDFRGAAEGLRCSLIVTRPPSRKNPGGGGYHMSARTRPSSPRPRAPCRVGPRPAPLARTLQTEEPTSTPPSSPSFRTISASGASFCATNTSVKSAEYGSGSSGRKAGPPQSSGAPGQVVPRSHRSAPRSSEVAHDYGDPARGPHRARRPARIQSAPGIHAIVPTVFCACAAGTAVTIVSIARPRSAAIRKETHVALLLLIALSFFAADSCCTMTYQQS